MKKIILFLIFMANFCFSSWSDKATLESEQYFQNCNIVMEGDNVFSAWIDTDGSNYYVKSKYSTDGGNSWSEAKTQFILGIGLINIGQLKVAMSDSHMVMVLSVIDIMASSKYVYANSCEITSSGWNWKHSGTWTHGESTGAWDEIFESSNVSYFQVGFKGSNVVVAGGNTTSTTLFIEYSLDSGSSWEGLISVETGITMVSGDQWPLSLSMDDSSRAFIAFLGGVSGTAVIDVRAFDFDDLTVVENPLQTFENYAYPKIAASGADKAVLSFSDIAYEKIYCSFIENLTAEDPVCVFNKDDISGIENVTNALLGFNGEKFLLSFVDYDSSTLSYFNLYVIEGFFKGSFESAVNLSEDGYLVIPLNEYDSLPQIVVTEDSAICFWLEEKEGELSNRARVWMKDLNSDYESMTTLSTVTFDEYYSGFPRYMAFSNDNGKIICSWFLYETYGDYSLGYQSDLEYSMFSSDVLKNVSFSKMRFLLRNCYFMKWDKKKEAKCYKVFKDSALTELVYEGTDNYYANDKGFFGSYYLCWVNKQGELEQPVLIEN